MRRSPGRSSSRDGARCWSRTMTERHRATAGRTPTGVVRRWSTARHRGRAARRTAGCRSSTCRRAADQPFVKDGLHAQLQRRALQLPRAARRAGRRRASGSRTASDTEVVLEAWRRVGPGAPARASAGCSPSRSTTSAPATLALARDQLGIKPLFVHAAAATASLFASELKALVGRRRPRARRSTRGALVASLAVLLGARGALRAARACTSSRRAPGPSSDPTARDGRGRFWDPRRGRAARPPRPARRTCAAVSRSRSRRTSWPTCPSPTFLSGGLDSSLVTALAAAAQPGDRRVHHHLPARGPAARGDARRRASTPASWPAQLGIRLHEIEISPDVVDMLPRMVDVARRADRRPGRDQHRSHLRGRPRRRRQGAAVGHGRRRAVRRLPQAPGLPARPRATAGCPARCGPRVVAPAVDRLPVAVGGRGLRHGPLGQALPDLRRAARGGGVPAQLHPLRRRTSSRDLLDPDLGRPGRQPWSTSTARVYDDSRPRRPRQPDVPHRHPAVPARASTWPTPTGPAWRRRPRSGCPFVDPDVLRGGVLASRRARRSAAATQKVAAQARPPRTGCPSEIIDRPKALVRRAAAGLGRPTTSAAGRRRPARRATWSSVGLPAPAAAAADGRRPAQRAARPVQADLAAAEPGALVPQHAAAGPRRDAVERS